MYEELEETVFAQTELIQNFTIEFKSKHKISKGLNHKIKVKF